MMNSFEKTKRNRVRRSPERASYDKRVIYAIMDEALFCHIGFVYDQQVYVVPTLHVRRGNEILIHGASTSRLMKHAGDGHELCITATLLDGLVLARSVFNHSANYRSVMVFGKGKAIIDKGNKIEALRFFTQRILPGRWEDARQPNERELKATSVVSVPINLASAKVRQGPPIDEPEDYQLKVWAGVLPIKQQFGEPEMDPKLTRDTDLPAYFDDFVTNN